MENTTKIKPSKKFTQAIVIVFAAWIISIGIIYIKAWVGPTSSPAEGSGAIAVDGSGNVGIPTTDASYKLNVTGNVNATAYYGDGSNLTGISSGVAIRDTYRNLVIKNGATPASQMDVDIDEIILQDTSANLLRAANVNLTINMPGTVGSINSLDTGSEASGTWYHIWVISNGSTTAGLFSTSSTAPTMPSGYTYKAYVGATRNVGNNFLTIWQTDNKVIRPYYGVTNLDSVTTWTPADITAAVPTTAKKIGGRLYIYNQSNKWMYVAPVTGVTNEMVAGQVTAESNGTSSLIVPYVLTLIDSTTIYRVTGGGSTLAKIGINNWEY